MKLSIKTEISGPLSFLDVKIFRENYKFVTSVFRIETLSVICANFISFIPLEYKIVLVLTLLNRFNLSSDFLKFNHEVYKLQKILSKNAYPQKFIDQCIQKFLNNMYIQKPQIPTVTTKELVIILPFLGKMFHIIKTRITKFMNKHIKFGNLRVIFHTNNRLRNYLRFKYFVPETLRSSLIYKFSYRICTTSYIGKTYQHFKVRVSENQCVSPRTCKPVKGTLSTLLGITCLFVTI